MTALSPVDTAAAPFSPAAITQEEAAAMFRAAVNLFRLWGVTDEEAAVLLDQPVRSYRRWKAGEIGRIDRDGAARLSNLMGIHKALRLIFREPQRGYAWIKAGVSMAAAETGRAATSVLNSAKDLSSQADRLRDRVSTFFQAIRAAS